MRIKTIQMTLDPETIRKAIRRTEQFQAWVLEKTKELLTELAEIGVDGATVRFGQAEYDGTNDVEVNWEELEDNLVAVIATAKLNEYNTALFIEFGTGVKYPDDHPEKPAGLLGRGKFGLGRGSNPKGWEYIGEPGTHGKQASKTRPNLIRTLGNKANMPMYKTVRELEERFEEIARRVFND